MSMILIFMIAVVLGVALFDFIYYLPRFKALEESEEKLQKNNHV